LTFYGTNFPQVKQQKNKNTTKLKIQSMSETTTQTTPPGQEVDPLAQAAGGIDTTIPLLAADRIMRLECIKSDVAPTKSDPNRLALTIVCKTTKDGTFTSGKKAHAGYKLYKRVSVTPSEPTESSEGRDVAAIVRDLAAVLKAFFGGQTAKTPRELLNNPAMLEGLLVDGRITIEKGSGGFSDKNGVNFIIPA